MAKRQKREVIKIGNQEYLIMRILGTKKGIDHYLSTDNKGLYVILEKENATKEEAETFVKNEVESYKVLSEIGIKIPKLKCSDQKQGLVVREYIEGVPASNHIFNCELKADHLDQIRDMSITAERNNICLDYFPTNYVIRRDKVNYVSYEWYPYNKEYSFDNKIKQYWLNSNSVVDALSRM